MYIVSKTFGCFSSAPDNVDPAEISSIIFSIVLFNKGFIVFESIDSRASISGTPAFSITDNCLEKLYIASGGTLSKTLTSNFSNTDTFLTVIEIGSNPIFLSCSKTILSSIALISPFTTEDF